MPVVIFVSYRRGQTSSTTQLLVDRLRVKLAPDKVYCDLDIRPGDDFRQHIDAALNQSVLGLALIGPDWDPPRYITKRTSFGTS